jgi:hypothetical protein
MTIDAGSKRVGVLLSGIGGWEVGLHLAGWELAWSCEQDAGKRGVLARNLPIPCYANTADVAAARPSLQDGLLVIGGLQHHGMDDQTWADCLSVLESSQPRWVVIETVHTTMSQRWPGSFAAACDTLHRRGYATMWFMTVLGLQQPATRWARLIIIGWPIGYGIPATLATRHGGVVGVGNEGIVMNGQLGQVYPNFSAEIWGGAFGFPDGWLLDAEPWRDWLEIASAPRVTYRVAKALLEADSQLTQLLDLTDTGVLA